MRDWVRQFCWKQLPTKMYVGFKDGASKTHQTFQIRDSRRLSLTWRAVTASWCGTL